MNSRKRELEVDYSTETKSLKKLTSLKPISTPTMKCGTISFKINSSSNLTTYLKVSTEEQSRRN